jgi:hypothetical protein
MRGSGMKRLLMVIILILFGVSGVFAAPFPGPDYQRERDRKPPERVKEAPKKPEDNRDRKGKDDKKKDDRRRPY